MVGMLALCPPYELRKATEKLAAFSAVIPGRHEASSPESAVFCVKAGLSVIASASEAIQNLSAEAAWIASSLCSSQ
jgi:hypothetical protein